jgi:hypothetical protein
MASSSANKNMVIINDEVTSFTQYYEESLMEAWYCMQENVGNSPNVHTQSSIIRSFYNGISAWGKIFLDGLTNGQFSTGDPSFAKYTLESLFENYGKTKEEIKLQQFKEELEEVVNKLQEAIKKVPNREEISNLCTYTHSKIHNYNKCFNIFGKKVRAIKYHATHVSSNVSYLRGTLLLLLFTSSLPLHHCHCFFFLEHVLSLTS